MEKRLINILISLLFSFTFVLTVFSLTVLSKNFVHMVVKQKNYYTIVYENVNNNKYGIKIDKKDIKKDLDKYIKSRYVNNYIILPNRIDNDDFREFYNKSIKFDGFFENIDITFIIFIIYFVDIMFIIVTGIILNKTKNFHNINKIILFNFVITVILFGFIKVFVLIDNYIINEVIKMFNYYYLGLSIILLDLVIFQRIKTKFL